MSRINRFTRLRPADRSVSGDMVKVAIRENVTITASVSTLKAIGLPSRYHRPRRARREPADCRRKI